MCSIIEPSGIYPYIVKEWWNYRNYKWTRQVSDMIIVMPFIMITVIYNKKVTCGATMLNELPCLGNFLIFTPTSMSLSNALTKTVTDLKFGTQIPLEHL